MARVGDDDDDGEGEDEDFGIGLEERVGEVEGLEEEEEEDEEEEEEEDELIEEEEGFLLLVLLLLARPLSLLSLLSTLLARVGLTPLPPPPPAPAPAPAGTPALLLREGEGLVDTTFVLLPRGTDTVGKRPGTVSRLFTLFSSL